MPQKKYPGFFKPKPLYVPPVNPLPKTILVRPYRKADGTVVPAHRAKPKFRRNINPLA